MLACHKSKCNKNLHLVVFDLYGCVYVLYSDEMSDAKKQLEGTFKPGWCHVRCHSDLGKLKLKLNIAKWISWVAHMAQSSLALNDINNEKGAQVRAMEERIVGLS